MLWCGCIVVRCVDCLHLPQANVFEIPTRREDASALPRMQIVPVLRCGGSTGAALVAHFSKLEGLSKAEPAGATVTIILQPISVWCTLPLLGHLQSFVTAAALPCVVPPSHLAATVVHSHPSGKAAVTAAIEAILQHQQESRWVSIICQMYALLFASLWSGCCFVVRCVCAQSIAQVDA